MLQAASSFCSPTLVAGMILLARVSLCRRVFTESDTKIGVLGRVGRSRTPLTNTPAGKVAARLFCGSDAEQITELAELGVGSLG